LSKKLIVPAILVIILVSQFAVACGDGPEELKLASCQHSTTHFVDLLDHPVPVQGIQPSTHLQSFEFKSCLSTGDRVQAENLYDGLEVVIDEVKLMQAGFSSKEEMSSWFQQRLTEVMRDQFPQTFNALSASKAERAFRYYFVKITPRIAGPGLN